MVDTLASPSPERVAFILSIMRDIRITGGEKNGKDVTVWFASENTKDFYYAHSISSIGNESDESTRMDTLWSWITHLRHKTWWNDFLENDFINTVTKYL